MQSVIYYYDRKIHEQKKKSIRVLNLFCLINDLVYVNASEMKLYSTSYVRLCGKYL